MGRVVLAMRGEDSGRIRVADWMWSSAKLDHVQLSNRSMWYGWVVLVRVVWLGSGGMAGQLVWYGWAVLVGLRGWVGTVGWSCVGWYGFVRLVGFGRCVGL